MSEASAFVSILPSNATPWMLAVEKTSGERWDNLDVDIIRRARDPWTCPSHLLNFLAFERSVDIWDETWDELKKRSVIASAPADHRLKGTETGIRRYIEIADGELRQVIVPPEGFYASPELTKAEHEAYIARHPKVRITLDRGHGTAPVGLDLIADDGFADDGFALLDLGRALYGRKAYLRRPDGTDEPLQLVDVRTEDREGNAVVFEQIILPAPDPIGLYADDGFVDQAFASVDDIAQRTYSIALDRSYSYQESRLSLSPVGIGYEVRDTSFKRESDIGDAGPFLFADDGIADVAFIERDRADELLADVLYLIDPTVPVPQSEGGSFADVDRLGVPPFTAELMIKVWESDPAWVAYADETYADEDFAGVEDPSRREFVLDAVVSSKALRDQVFATFQTTRERLWADGFLFSDTSRPVERLSNSL